MGIKQGKKRIVTDGEYDVVFTGSRDGVFCFENDDYYYTEKTNTRTVFMMAKTFDEVGKIYTIKLKQDGDFLRIFLPGMELTTAKEQ